MAVKYPPICLQNGQKWTPFNPCREVLKLTILYTNMNEKLATVGKCPQSYEHIQVPSLAETSAWKKEQN